MKALTRSQKNSVLSQYRGMPIYLTKDYAYNAYFVFPREAIQDVLDWWNVPRRCPVVRIDGSRLAVPPAAGVTKPDPTPALLGPWKPAFIETRNGLPVFRVEKMSGQTRLWLGVSDGRKVDAGLLRVAQPPKVANRLDEMEWSVPDNGASEPNRVRVTIGDRLVGVVTTWTC